MSASFRLRWYPRAVLLAVAAVVAASALAASGSRALVGDLGGDFASFYAAGKIVLRGDTSDLYEVEVQREAQQGLTSDGDGVVYFAYPPHTAVAYAPLAVLPYRLAYVLHTALMGLALWAAVRAGRRLAPRLLADGDRILAAVAVAMVTYPVFRSVLGGQNATLTLLLAVAAWGLAAEGRDAAAGLAVGALLFKPHYALLVLVLFVIAGRWRVVSAAVPVGAVLWVVSAVVAGPWWIGEWLARARRFDAVNVESGGALMVSIGGFVRNALSGWQVVALIVAGAVLVGGPTAWRWLRSGPDRRAVALAAPAVPLLAAAALYYDAAMLLVPVALVLDDRPKGRASVVAVVILGATWLQLFADLLGWSPLFPVLLASWLLATRAPMTRV